MPFQEPYFSACESTPVSAGPLGVDGVFALGEMDDDDGMAEWHEGDGFVGTLSLPFAHVAPWNDLTGKPDDQLAESHEPRYEAEMNAFEKNYFGSANMNGAIPICHMGCALRIWLVVSGAEKGHIWFDRRADYEGLEPVTNDRGQRMEFLEWYEEWVTSALSEPPSGS